MANQPGLEAPLRWTGGYFREPVWPREPDIAAIKSIARQHLQSQLPLAIEDEKLEASFFAEGLYNKLYKISYPGHHPSYLLRVTVPVLPYLKTESEVATIAYLRANTSVPVPRVIAWQSNNVNELGYEWMLMEVIDGVPLFKVWREIPWEQKLELVDKLARHIKDMQDHSFASIGALYFKTALEHEKQECVTATDQQASTVEEVTKVELKVQDADTDEASVSTDFQTLQLHTSLSGTLEHAEGGLTTVATRSSDQHTLANDTQKDDFAVGPLFNSVFFVENKTRLPGDRGPYPDQIKWLSELINIQMELVKDVSIEDSDDFDDYMAKDAPLILSLGHEFLEILPAVFGKEEGLQAYCLHHSDLNLANILVDPETFAITGIVDWELVNVVPRWEADEHPEFMQSSEPLDEEEPPIPSYENPEHPSVYTRDRWDNRLLRRHWDETMTRLRQGTDTDADTSTDAGNAEAKRKALAVLYDLTENWTWVSNWMKKYKASNISDDRGESDAGAEDKSEVEEDIS